MLLISRAARRAAFESVFARATARTTRSLESDGDGALLTNWFDFASHGVRAQLHLLLPMAAMIIATNLYAQLNQVARQEWFALAGGLMIWMFAGLTTVVPMLMGAILAVDLRSEVLDDLP